MSKTIGLFDIFNDSKNSNDTQLNQPQEIVVNVPGGKTPGKYSKSDIDKLLIGYVVLPKSLWLSLGKGTHIRYMRNDGRFVRGGFVNSYVSQNNRNMLTLANGFNASERGYSIWTVSLDGVRSIYVKKDKMPTKHVGAISTYKTDDITTLKKNIASLQKRIQQIENKSIKK